MSSPDRSRCLPGPDAGNPDFVATAADDHLDHERVVRILSKRLNAPAPAVGRCRCALDGSPGTIEIIDGLTYLSSHRLPRQRTKLLELLRGKHRGKRRPTRGRIGGWREREQLREGQQRGDRVVKKGRKTRSRTSSGMPGPLSSTETRHARAAESICPWTVMAGVTPADSHASAALRSRLPNTWRSSASSPWISAKSPSIAIAVLS